VVIHGENLGPATIVTIGGITLPPSAILSATDSEIRVVVPALAAPPDGDLLVGIAVRNGAVEAFPAAPFTYATDPRIDEIGQFDPATGTVASADHLVRFDAGDFIGLRGPGLGAGTSVRVNGKPAPELALAGPRTLRFRVPDDTIGPLHIEASNAGFTDT